MRPKNSNSGSEEEQRANEQNSGQQPMQGPRAASERHVEEVEAKVEENRQFSEDLYEEQQQEILDLRHRLEEQREYIAKLDLLVNAVYQMAATREGEPPLNTEMPHMVPENKSEDDEADDEDGELSVSIGGEPDA